jgi:tRNA nucleotidyltransferase (CCA-adding enzyme)
MTKIKDNKKLVNKVLIKLQKISWIKPYINKITNVLISNNYNFYFVGGTIRDILISIFNNNTFFDSQDVDLVVETNDYHKIVTVIQNIFSTNERIQIQTYPQFLTFSLVIPSKDQIKRIDFSIPRKEEYPEQSVLPKVSIGTIFDDVYRRDFAINAICLRYDNYNKSYTFYDPFNGIQDIIDKKIRVLHNKSFVDDPTRIIRGIRFAASLKFKFDPITEDFINKAIKDDVISLLSLSRINTEFICILKKGKNLYLVSKYFKKYHIEKYYNHVKNLFSKFIINAKKIELKKIKNTTMKFYIRLFYLLEKTAGKVELLEFNKIQLFKEYLTKLNIPKKDRQPIYNAVRIYALGDNKNLPKWLKIYSDIYKRSIKPLPIKASKLISLGLPKEKINSIFDYIIKQKIKKLTLKKIKSITLKFKNN